MKTGLGILMAACLTALGVAAGPFAPSGEPGPFSPSGNEGFFQDGSEPLLEDEGDQGLQVKAADTCTKRSPSGLILPLCKSVRVTAEFNETTTDDNYPRGSDGHKKRHVGVDYASRIGDSVYAPAAGIVRMISTGSWGKNRAGKDLSAVVIVANRAGPLRARFWVLGHIEPAVKVGTVVRAGQKVGTASMVADHHTHVGTGTSTHFPDDRLGRQDESRTDVSPFIDPVEVLAHEWRKEAIAELERSRKKLKFPVHTRESACKGELRVSEQCWQRRYVPRNTRNWYTLVADVERRQTLLCVKDRYRDCFAYDEEW